MTNKKQKGLGRGLAALFGDAKNDIQQKKANISDLNKHKMANISDLTRNPYQPRLKFDEEKLKELAKSIKQNGIIQPIAVRLDKFDSNKYEIVAGERRWLASQQAGLHEIPIVVLELDDRETLEIAILENIQREDLSAIEEAKGYEKLNKEFRYDQDRIAQMMSKSRSHISNTMRLLTLPKDVIDLIEDGLLTAGQARPLIGLSNPSVIAEEIVKKKLSARAVESLAKEKKIVKNHLKAVDANILEIQKKIEDQLGLKVIISNKKNNSGKISIEYKNLDQFELVSNLLKK
ncbi:MAG: chromosome partitioning protein ParB [Candidatus Pelagibacter sp.]|nr:chromosome partitioning protein ParB [Candidatus Pelagibacter sp.]RPG11098.1 MAG: ParB/RepB/Spo0J family partition protein [Pelagibacteraceae bacterium TMED170]